MSLFHGPIQGTPRATVITSQLPGGAWHDAMQDETAAEAVLDRLVHKAHEFGLQKD